MDALLSNPGLSHVIDDELGDACHQIGGRLVAEGYEHRGGMFLQRAESIRASLVFFG